jgi:hypothetical protein
MEVEIPENSGALWRRCGLNSERVSGYKLNKTNDQKADFIQYIIVGVKWMIGANFDRRAS